MSDDFTAKKSRWLAQIASDPNVSAFDFRVAFLIAEHLNRKTGDAWPSQKTLVRRTGKSERAIRNAISRLRDAE